MLVTYREIQSSLGQTVEKPQGLSGKTSPGGESEDEGFSEGKPEGAARGFPRGAGTVLPKGVVWNNFKKTVVKSVHYKSQTAPIENQSL